MSDDAVQFYEGFRKMLRAELTRALRVSSAPQELAAPASVEAEGTILGAVLLDNAAYKEAAARLSAEDFSLDSHRLIFERMGEMISTGKSVDLVTLLEALGGASNVGSVGGTAYLASLLEGLPRKLAIGQYADIVKEKARLRKVIHACETAITKAADQTLTAAEVVEQLGNSLRGMRGKK